MTSAAGSPTRCERCSGPLVASSAGVGDTCLLCGRPGPEDPPPDYVTSLAAAPPRRCACGCGAPVVAPKRRYSSASCRMREWRRRRAEAKRRLEARR